MQRSDFIKSLATLPSIASLSSLKGAPSELSINSLLKLGLNSPAKITIKDYINHPLYWWPTTLLSYPILISNGLNLEQLSLTEISTGNRIPFQLSKAVTASSGEISAVLNFFSELPSGASREYLLEYTNQTTTIRPQVSDTLSGSSIILDSGRIKVRIPISQDITTTTPGPILQISRGGKWFGQSEITFKDDTVKSLTTEKVESGPLFISYRLTYVTAKNATYRVTITCKAGMEFVHMTEDMNGLLSGTDGILKTSWSDFKFTHRQAPNHPFPLPDSPREYQDYPWEKIDSRFVFDKTPSPDGKFPFTLGIYERAPANFHFGTFANFWNENTNDALGLFIDDVLGWQDYQYSNEIESSLLQIRYYAKNSEFYWEWPLAKGTRSTCIACYDHEKDKQTMRELETYVIENPKPPKSRIPLTFTSYTLFLQNRYGSLNLNQIKDWILTYPDSGRSPMRKMGSSNGNHDEFFEHIMHSSYVCTLPLTGTRQMAGHGPIPGRSIVNFSPVPSRQIAGWVEQYTGYEKAFSIEQKHRLTAVFLLLAYIHTGDEFMPLVNMLAGHPNFLADVKAVPPAMAFLFPDHPMAPTWADMWEKCLQINTRFNTRPAVKAWDTRAGRWTENIGTYVWAFLRPSLRTDYLLKLYDGNERMLSPELANMTEWLTNALSAPFMGESEKGYDNLLEVDEGREWGVVGPNEGPRRVHPPQGAHSEQRIPPRQLWCLANYLRNYAPLASEHGMWASRPTDNDSESRIDKASPWNAMYPKEDNYGTNPHLKSAKFTGYGIILRAAVDTKDELSIHLQQIDQGPNYRWGRAGEGGNGIIYFYAGGKSFSYTAPEDAGDRDDQDTDFCTTFGIFREGQFRSIGMNTLSRPMYNLGLGQFAEITPREGPGSYASPEYISRSILLVSNDYFIIYDNLSDQSLEHRFTWFVRKGDSFPNIKLLLGAFGTRETQHTQISTSSSTGVWHDGIGDSLAVISHRNDIKSELTSYGCSVTTPTGRDMIFRKPDGINYSDSQVSFTGAAGLIRVTKESTYFALFHGKKLKVSNLTFSTTDTDLGISGTLTLNSVCGKCYAPKSSEFTLSCSPTSNETHFYLDGVSQGIVSKDKPLTVILTPGEHSWELSTDLPTPLAPDIIRTENFSTGGRIFINPSAGSTRYTLQVSTDNARTWKNYAAQSGTVFNLSGLTNETKVHVRSIASNCSKQSEPGPEYPLYVTSKPPHAPEGLHVKLSEGQAELTWGQILGAKEYRLYGRVNPDRDFKLIYQGPKCSVVDKRTFIKACNAQPSPTSSIIPDGVIEYCVTSVTDNAESKASRIASTDPTSWRNWDPKPNEPFRRVNNISEDYMKPSTETTSYYPQG